MRRLLALVAVLALVLLTGSAVTSALAGPAVPTASVTATSETELGATTGVAVDDAALPLRSHSVLPSTPLLVQRPHVLPRALILVVALVATAVARPAVRRAMRVSTGWSPRFHLRFGGAPLRGPPQGTIPALGI